VKYTNRAAFLNQIRSAASVGSLSRVYFVGVPHDYERLEVCDAILKYLPPDGSIRRFSSSDEVSDHLGSHCLFGGEPIAIVENAEKLKSVEIPRYGYLILAAKSKTSLSEQVEKEGIVLDLLNEKPWEKEKRIAAQLEAKVKSAGTVIAPDALALLMERQDLDAGLLEREIDKLICYAEGKIGVEDVLALCASTRSFALWQTAEALIWEGTGHPDGEHFHALIPALRSQLQLGLKIATLLAENAPSEEWTRSLPKVYPKTLEKRTSQAQRLGTKYFSRGLIALFDIELRSRTGSTQYAALLDLFRAKLKC